jgi:deoxyribodipyrimidine photolyase-like uncharacterized protein
MTQDDILRMAREAGFNEFNDGLRDDGSRDTYLDCWPENLERFVDLVAAAQREKVVHWMRSMGYATGHGDTIEDLLDHLGTQIAERQEAEVLMERKQYEHTLALQKASYEREIKIEVEAEREACAVIAETPVSGEQDDITMEAKDRVAATIRARSKT